MEPSETAEINVSSEDVDTRASEPGRAIIPISAGSGDNAVLLSCMLNNKIPLPFFAAACASRVSSGAIRVEINQRYPLSDIARAHEDLESRRTTGSTIIEP